MKLYKHKGIALFVVISIMFLLSLGAAAVLLTAYNYANVTENQIRRTRALILAESGINYAYWKIRIGEDETGPVDFSDGSLYTLTPPISIPAGWSIAVEVQNTGRIRLRSTVTYPKASVF